MNTHSVQLQTNQHQMPAPRCTQDISLTVDSYSDTSDNSTSPNMPWPQGLKRPAGENPRTYSETCGLDNFKLSRAPQIATIALPKKENGEDFCDDFSYRESESNVEGGLMLLDCFDSTFPELSAIEVGEFD